MVGKFGFVTITTRIVSVLEFLDNTGRKHVKLEWDSGWKYLNNVGKDKLL